jgi:hypothetical protein
LILNKPRPYPSDVLAVPDSLRGAALTYSKSSSQPFKLSPWETAYSRFESPEQEIQKFTRRLNKLGAANWPRDADIVELFCGRGNGLHALSQLGFTRLEGVDLSADELTPLFQRARLLAKLKQQDGRHLILVKYGP